MRILIVICVLGLYKLNDVKEEMKNVNIALMFISVITLLTVESGKVFSAVQIVTLLIFYIGNYYYRLCNPVIEEEHFRDLFMQHENLKLLNYQLENKLSSVIDELAPYKFQMEDHVTQLNNILIQARMELNMKDTEGLERSILQIQSVLYSDSADLRTLNAELFSDLHTNRQRKRAIRKIQEFRKEIEIGQGFDLEMLAYINLLEKEIVADRPKRKRRGFRRW